MRSIEPMLMSRNLSAGYRTSKTENRLFENLNLDLFGGEMVCFMGPNGSGKSSLLRTLAGLQPPLAGEIILRGQSAPFSKSVAVVLTDKITAMNLTVAEVISLGRYPYLGWSAKMTRADDDIISRTVQKIRISALLKTKLFELSDGQAQMVMIARAIAQDTPIILLDEPTAHLDLNNRLEIMNILHDLARTEGKAILLATHELDLALQTADRIWLAGKNKMIRSGFPEDLVLRGSFDEIFELKGYDLRSGRVIRPSSRNDRVNVVGTGSALLWTRNALERNGFEISEDASMTSVQLLDASGELRWLLKKNEGEIVFDSLEKLVAELNK